MRKIREKINKIPLALAVLLVLCSAMLFGQATGAWTPASAGASDLGSTTAWFKDLYFGNATGFYFKATGVPTAARTITVPDNSFTLNADNVIDAVSATALTAAQSGSLVLFDSGTAFLATLPAPAAGLKYDFFVKTSANGHGIITKTTTTDFLVGGPTITTGASTGVTALFACNGTTHVAIRQNGTTSGGIAGTWFQARGMTSTLWEVHGLSIGSGSIVTPCSTS